MVTKHVEQAVLARFMPFRGGYVAVMRKESTRIGNGRDLCQRQAPCELLVPGVGTRTESPAGTTVSLADRAKGRNRACPEGEDIE